MSNLPRPAATIPVEEAIALANSAAKSLALISLNVVKAYFEVVEPDLSKPGDTNPTLNTNQAQFPEESGLLPIRTEFSVTIRIRPPEGNPQEPFDVAISFATQTAYRFSPDIPSIEANRALGQFDT